MQLTPIPNMHRLFSLYRTLRKCDSRSTISENEKNSVEIQIDQAKLIVIIAVVAAIVGIGYLGYGFSNVIDFVGGAPVVMKNLGLILGLGTAVFSLVRMINSLYMSSDIGILITMPLSVIEIAITKIMNIFMNSFFIIAGVLLAFVAGYSIHSPAAFTVWIGMVFYMILIPLFTTSCVAILSILIMSFVRVFRSREVLKVIGAFFSLGVLLLWVYFERRNVFNLGTQDMVERVVKTFERFAYTIPIVPFVDKFTESGDIISLAIAVIICAASIGLMLLTIKMLYLDGALQMQDSAGNSKVLKHTEFEKQCQSKSQRKSYLVKEFYMVRRNPTYLLSNFIMTFAWPVIYIPIFLLQNSSGDASSSSIIEDMIKLAGGTEVAQKEVRIYAILTLTFLTVSVVVSLVTMMNNLAYSSIIREGKSFELMRQLPVSMHDQICAKRDLARIFVSISSIGYLVVGALIGVVMGRIPWYAIPYGLVIAAPLVSALVDVDMIFGVSNPKLDWDNEQSATKKPFGCSVVSIVVLFGSMILGIILLIEVTSGFSAFPIIVAIPILLTILAVVIRIKLFQIIDQNYVSLG